MSWLGGNYRRNDKIPRDLIRRIFRALMELRIHAAWPLVLDHQTNTLSLDLADDMFYIRLRRSYSDGTYDWEEMIADPAGGGNMKLTSRHNNDGDDLANELNRNPSVPSNAYTGGTLSTPGPVFECWRDSRHRLRFRASQC